jgi:hypothetical protein
MGRNVLEKPAAAMVREIHTSILNMEGTGVTWWVGANVAQYFFHPRIFFWLLS